MEAYSRRNWVLLGWFFIVFFGTCAGWLTLMYAGFSGYGGQSLLLWAAGGFLVGALPGIGMIGIIKMRFKPPVVPAPEDTWKAPNSSMIRRTVSTHDGPPEAGSP